MCLSPVIGVGPWQATGIRNGRVGPHRDQVPCVEWQGTSSRRSPRSVLQVETGGFITDNVTPDGRLPATRRHSDGVVSHGARLGWRSMPEQAGRPASTIGPAAPGRLSS
jgi:hypothetical protein